MANSPTLDTTNNLIALDMAKDHLGIDPGAAQNVDIVCLNENADGGIAGEYFLVSSALFDYYVWYDVGASPSDPAVSNRVGIEVDISDGDSATAVATATAAKVTAVTGMTSTSEGSVVHIVNDGVGVVTAPTAGTTPFTVTVHIDGAVSDPTSDSIIIDLINDASWFFNGETHRKLKAQALTEYYDGPGGYVLYLKNPPISGLTLSQDSASPRVWGADTVIASDDYELDTSEGRILLTGDVFSTELHVIQAAYTGGFSTIPYDLQRVMVEMVAQNYLLTTHKSQATKSRSGDKGGTTSYLHELSPKVERVLERLKRVAII